VDLDDTNIAMQHGLDPSEADCDLPPLKRRGALQASTPWVGLHVGPSVDAAKASRSTVFTPLGYYRLNIELMPLGNVKLTLRPLRFAFLVDPADRAGILEAIQLSTFLWGGTFNPIVPVFRRTPKAWRDPLGRASAKDLSEGLLHAFDPDYVALVGKYTTLTIAAGHRPVIHASDILEGLAEDWVPRYGITILEPLSYFIEKELRFVRREPFDVRLPSFSGPGSLFLSSVFGAIPSVAQQVFDTQFRPALEGKSVPCTLSNYAELLRPTTLFLRRVSSFFVQPMATGFQSDDNVFLLDATNPLDVIDYWNLRAVGRNVIPVAIQTSQSDAIRSLVKEFIEENFQPLRGNPSIYNTTTLLKSRSISEEQLRDFGERLGVTPSAEPNWGKYTYQRWYPRIWDEWARDKDGVEPAALEVRTRTIDFSGDARIDVRTLDPKFAFRYSLNSEARFANEVEVRAYGASDLVAEVIPEGDDNLVRAIGDIDFRKWRFSRKGPVYLSGHLDWPLHLSVPAAETVFTEWLKSRGWEAKLSAPGRIAKQLLKQLKGVWGTALLANDNIIQLLGEMQGEKTIGLKALWAKLSRIANESGRNASAASLLERLVEAQVLRLGIEVQCPICTQHSWYSVTEADYELACRKCNEQFRMPAHAPKEIQWSYRTIGPFSLPGRAHGVYTVLLAYRFFSALLHQPTTPLLSFTAEKGADKIEADLGLLLKETHFGRTTIETLFAECKTYDHFKEDDTDRMLALSKAFPGAILVFATLRKDLTDAEKRLMRPLVNRGRKYWKGERPYNPVLILTGTELFGHFRPEESWSRAGGQYTPLASRFHRHNLSLLELCDVTQQIYLSMKPWRQWLQERWDLKRVKTTV
jgi:hypothetical protein